MYVNELQLFKTLTAMKICYITEKLVIFCPVVSLLGIMTKWC